MNQTNNIYQKLHAVQLAVKKGITKENENKFQKYKYFNERDLLEVLKPALETNKLLLIFSDVITPETPFTKEKIENNWFVTYLKKLEVINTENTEEQLIFNFWAVGQNNDLAKAKGSAETYSIKYFLQKFFLIPASDEELDPDIRANEIITPEQEQKLYDLFVSKRGKNRQIQTDFCKEVDQIVSKYGAEGETNTTNFRPRLKSLRGDDYQQLWNYLTKLPNQ